MNDRRLFQLQNAPRPTHGPHNIERKPICSPITSFTLCIYPSPCSCFQSDQMTHSPIPRSPDRVAVRHVAEEKAASQSEGQEQVKDGFRLLDQLFRIAVGVLHEGYMAGEGVKRGRLRKYVTLALRTSPAQS